MFSSDKHRDDGCGGCPERNQLPGPCGGGRSVEHDRAVARANDDVGSRLTPKFDRHARIRDVHGEVRTDPKRAKRRVVNERPGKWQADDLGRVERLVRGGECQGRKDALI